jgi:hypothetical protein
MIIEAKFLVQSRYLRHQFSFNFLFLFVMNLWLALRDGDSTYFNGVNAYSTSMEATKVWGWSDSGSYLQMGLSQVKFGELTPDLMWTASFWPPGMSYIYALAIKVVGFEGQFIYILALITALLWSLVLSLLIKVFEEFMRWWIAIALVFAIIQTDFYYEYLVRDAVIWSDGYSAAGLLLTLIISYFGVRKTKYRYFVVAGAPLAFTIYVRGQYFSSLKLIGALTFLIWTIWLTSKVLVSFRSIKFIPHISWFKAKSLILPLTLILTVSFTACLPYLLWQKDKLGNPSWDLSGNWYWTNGAAMTFPTNWRFQNDIAGFVWEGGGGTACKVDTRSCEAINTLEINTGAPFNIYDEKGYSSRDFYEMTRSTLFSHPISWFSNKAPYFYRYWISGPAVSSPTTSNYLFAMFSAVGLGLLCFSLCLKTLRQHFLIPSLLSYIFMGLTFVPPYIAHLEVRYLVPAKLLGIVVFVGASGAFANRMVTKSIMMFNSRYSQHHES